MTMTKALWTRSFCSMPRVHNSLAGIVILVKPHLSWKFPMAPILITGIVILVASYSIRVPLFRGTWRNLVNSAGFRYLGPLPHCEAHAALAMADHQLLIKIKQHLSATLGVLQWVSLYLLYSPPAAVRCGRTLNLSKFGSCLKSAER